jgi:hypothetical protein
MHLICGAAFVMDGGMMTEIDEGGGVDVTETEALVLVWAKRKCKQCHLGTSGGDLPVGVSPVVLPKASLPFSRLPLSWKQAQILLLKA